MRYAYSCKMADLYDTPTPPSRQCSLMSGAESRGSAHLGLQVGCQALLTELQLLSQMGQQGAQQLAAAAGVDHVLGLCGVRYNLQCQVDSAQVVIKRLRVISTGQNS